jgi:hypothetical protein
MTKKTQQNKSFTIFDWLKEITYTKSPVSKFSEKDWESFNPYMVTRFLSMSREYIDLVNYVQTIPYTEKEKYYRIYCEFTPKKQFFQKYIKSTKKSPPKDIIEQISKYYECSFGEAENYSYILGDIGIKEILTKLGYESK